MNPNAKEFSFNPGASSWAPPTPPAASTTIASGLTQPSTTTTPPSPPKVQEVKVEDVVKNTEELVISQEKEDTQEENNEGDDGLDENDPLWIATLKVSNGDREAALRLLDDPDALMAYPEIVAIMESSEPVGEEDWETNQDVAVKEATSEVSVEKTTTYKKQAPGKKVVEEEEVEEIDVDPREHMNIVFIGHVDAGKSTLSGSILYLMGKVDARTIERFEKEAKNRNRESWFLAFIMDTSEEERAKGKTVEVRSDAWCHI